MADVNANIGVNIDTSAALAQLKALQRQISQFHTSIAKSSESAAIAQKSLQKNLLGSINSIGAFSAELRTVKTSAETFTNSLEKNKFSMREYFRYAGASTKTFGRLFKSEFDTIGKVAQERVKTLQTQYIKMGRNASGAMEAIAIRPTSLNMQDLGTKTAIAAQKQALFNQLMKQGTTNLLNFGKNTQWAGRQLMVGFTIPLSIVGSTATKTFMDMEAQAIKFKKVYGDLFTPKAETQQALDDITELGRQFTKYGVAVSTTVGLAAEAAAAGFQGLDLQRQTTEATRLSILGQIDTQKALETTISLQNAFGMSSENLADSINFLNAVENQTVVSLDDITTAIPKVAPVIQQLGGDVKDLAFFLTAMKEGGINASEGANALKSGLAALINPTGRASEMLARFGINAREIVVKNKGDLKATVIEFAEALNQLDPLNRAQAIEQMFGKFQFARLSALFANVTKEGNQASRVLSLANSSVEELSALSEQELGMTADSAMNKFKKSVEDLKLALVPVGQAFLEAATPIVEFVGGVLEKFGNLSSGTKRLITVLTVAVGAIGPIFLMTFGLLANALANAMKGAMILRQGYLRLTGQSQILGEQTQYLNTEQLEAAAAAHSLDQSHAKLTQQFTAETAALQKLIAAYQSGTRAGNAFMLNNPGMMMPPRGAVKKLASGIVSVPGPKGAGDIVPAMLSPGEAVIPAKFVEKYGPLIQGMVSGNIPGYKNGLGLPIGNIKKSLGLFRAPYAVAKQTSQMSWETLPQEIQAVEQAASEILNKTVSDVKIVQQKLGNLKRRQASHIVPDIKSMMVGEEAINIKNWKAGNLQADLGYVNSYVNTIQQSNTIVEKFNKEHLDKAAKTLNMSMDEVSNELIKLKKGIHPTTRKSAQVLRQVAMTDPGYQGQAAAAGLGVRLSGNYYETLGSRTYDPAKDASAAKTTDRKIQKLEKQVIDRSSRLSQSAVNAAAKAAETQSPSKKTIKVGQDIARGLEVGMADRQDDVARAGTNLATAAVGGTKGGVTKIPFSGAVAANIPKTPALNLSDVTANARLNREKLLLLQQAKQGRILEESTRKFSNLNSKIMGGTFALTSLAGIASMAGGNLGKLSGIIFQFSSIMFGLSTVLQLLPKKLLTLTNLIKFGPLGVAIGVTIGIIKLVNDAREKERIAIEGVGRAANLTSKQIEKLGGILGFTPVKSNLEFAKPQVSGLSPQQSQQVEEVRTMLQDDKEFKDQVKGLKAATKEQADLIFKTLAIRLTGQGATKEAIQNYVYALQQEAERLDVSFDFKNIDLATAEGQAGLQSSVNKLLTDYKVAFDKGYKKTEIVTESGRRVGTKVVEVLSDEFKKQLFTSANVFASFFKGIETQLATGKINADQFTQSFNGLSNSIRQMPKAQGMMVLSEMLKTMPSEIAKAAASITDMNTQFRLLEATMLGVYITQDMLDQLLIKSTDGGADRAKGRVNRYLNEQIAEAKLEKEAIAKLMNLDPYKNTGNETKEKAKTELDVLKQAQAYVNVQEQLIDMANAPALKKYNDELKNQEKILKGINDKIDEITQDSINPLEARIKANSYLIDQIALKEEDINKNYDLQINALTKIKTINEEIANAEKSRLSLADALTRGDISAAASIAQESRERSASFAFGRVEASLTGSRDAQIAALGRNKLEKENKQLQLDIAKIQKDQIEPLNNQKLAVDKIIKSQNDLKTELEKLIEKRKSDITYLGLTKDKIDESVKALDLAQNANIDIKKDSFLRNALQLAMGDATRLEAALKAVARASSTAFSGGVAQNVESIVQGKPTTTAPTKAAPKPSAPTTKQTITIPATGGYGGIPYIPSRTITRAMGGMVPKYMAAGGKIGSDTVPAMLTPGEFVMNKRATQQFGPMLSMLNESKYPSMIGSSYSGQQPSSNNVSVSDNSNAVYNYNVGINVSDSNANPDGIARAVMNQIKYIDSQRIRGQK
jgi:TP901 family phage tail tape measure protein